MKTVLIDVKASYGFVGAEHKDTLEIEIPEGLTPEQEDDILSAEAYQWACQYVDYSYTQIDQR
jgi:hypothetical protein